MKMWIGSRAILVVSLPCVATATIHEGDYELENSDGVLPFTKITGRLTFADDYLGDVGTNLPHLEEVGGIDIGEDQEIELLFLPELIKAGDVGSPDYNDYIKEIRFPKLRSAGALTCWGYCELEKLFFPELKEVGNIYIIENFIESKLKQITFPALEKVGGALEKVGGADDPEFYIEGDDHLEELHLPSLKTVHGTLKVCGKKLKHVNLSKLETVTQAIRINCKALEFLYLPELKTLNRVRRFEEEEMSEFFVKLVVLPKIYASQFGRELFLGLEWKIEAFRISQQANDTCALAVVLGINWFENAIRNKGIYSNFSTMFRKKRNQDQRNLLSLDKSVLRRVWLMLQPLLRPLFEKFVPLWNNYYHIYGYASPHCVENIILDNRILVRKYKHILDQIS